ncbi:MAG: PAS domain S-box protein [Candidatus Limnocylindria bacterium]
MTTSVRPTFLDAAVALDALADAVVAADESSTIVYANAAAERLLGWPAEELIGRPVATIQPERLRETHAHAHRRYFATRVPRLMNAPVRLPAMRRDGTEIEIELSLSAIDSGGSHLVIASLRDLSQRVELERQLEVLGYLRASTLAATRLGALESMDDVLRTVVDTLVHDFSAALAQVWLHDAHASELILRATAAASDGAAADLAAAGLSSARLAEIATGRHPVVLSSPRWDPRVDGSALDANGVSAVATYPLLFGAELRGVIVDFSRRPLHEEMAEVLANYAAVVAAAIHDVELLDREHTAREEANRSLGLIDTLFATAPVGLAVWDTDFRFVRINSMLAAVNGLPAEAHVGRTIGEVLPPSLAARVGELMTQVVRTGEPVLEAPISAETAGEPGHVRDWLASYFPVRTAGGELVGVGGVVTDVTERKRTLEALSESEERFRLLVENVKDYAIFIQDPQGRVASWNEGAERILGYAADEVLGEHFSRFLPAEDVAAGMPEDELRTAATRGHAEIEGWRIRKDGSRFRANVVVTPLRDESGVLRGFAKVIRDVSEWRRTEERLQFLADASAILSSSLDYEQTLADVARLAVPALADWCAVHIVDANGEPQQLALAHADPAKIALAEEVQRRYPPDPEEPRGVWNVIRTGRPEFARSIPDSVLRAVARDDEHYELLRSLGLAAFMILPLISRGRAVGTITLVADGGGRTYGPADVTVAEDLASRAATAVDNALLYRDAQEAIGVRDEFLSLASHELRTPVTILHAYTQALTRTVQRGLVAHPASDGDNDLVPLDRGRLTNSIDAMEQAIARLVGLVEDLLDVSRLQRGSLQVNRIRTDLTSLVTRVVDGFRVQQSQGRLPAGLSIEIDLPDARTVWGDWDPDRLDQVVANLVENAIKYSPPDGSVVVTVAVQDGEHGAMEAHIAVRDGGIGIPVAQQDTIFAPYSRASNASARNYPGFGMGLAVAKEIIERLDGRIWAESGGEDQGSVFHVVLPGASLGDDDGAAMGDGDRD